MPAPSIGRSIPRVDGAAKVTGAARYVADVGMPGALAGVTVRSSVAAGVLEAVNLDPLFDWSGVTVVTAADVPGRNFIALMSEDQPALVPVGGRIRHVDEPIALVAASDPARAAAAARAVTLRVRETTPVLDLESSKRAAEPIHGEDNVLKHIEVHKGGDVDAALAGADIIIEGTYRTGAQEQMYIEPQGMIAWWEGGRCHVLGSMQCPYYVHSALKAIFDLCDTEVVVEQAVTGGGFGGKEEYPSMLAVHTALLAKKAGAPVRIIYSRSEDIAATTKRHPAVVRHRLGVKRDGSLVACDIEIDLDGGAYVTLTPVVLSRAVLHAAGPYRIPNVRVIGNAYATNTPPHGAFRGFGAPQVTFAYERQIDKAARAVGVDPFTFRRNNMLRLGDTTSTGQELRYSVGSTEVMDAVEHAAARPAPRPRLGSGPYRRGRGLAFYFHGAGFTGAGEMRLKGQVAVAVTASGDIEVRSASTDIGQGPLTIFSQMAAAALGVDPADVRVAPPKTDMVPNSGPTVASRTCMVVGSVVQKAAALVRARLDAFARERGDGRGDMLAVARAYAREHGELEEIATYESPPGISFDEVSYRGDAYPVYGWAACLCDVAVDLDTFEVTVERLVHAIDVGKAIHPVIVEGQIEGGTLQALGWALWEHVAYRSGRVANRRMTDCIVPTSIEAPEMETIIVEVPYPHGPHGAKGVGEIPMDGPAAAVANAIDQALGDMLDASHRPDQLPLLPEVIAQLLRGVEPKAWVA